MSIRKFLVALGLCAAMIAPALVSAQSYVMVNGYKHYFPHRAKGVIVNVDKTVITLRSGRHIFLKDGTVINPTGAILHVGQLIDVFGPPGGEGSINAREIDILRRHPSM